MPNTSALISRLHHLDKNVRLDAAMALGTTADADAVSALAAQLVSEPDFFVREALVWALVRIGAPAVDPMIALLAHPDAPIRTQAAHALSKLGDVRAVPALRDALHDDTESVVQKAVYALGVLRQVSVLPALLDLLDRQSTSLRNALHDALLAFGAASIPALTSRLADPKSDTRTRVSVIEILAGIGGDAAVPSLSASLLDADWQVRFAAVHALSESRIPDLATRLAPVADDEHPHVRMLATRVLGTRV